MEFNPRKCKVLTVTNKIKPVQHYYKMHGIYLEYIFQEKYLGVILHRKLSWKPHESNVVAKANSTRCKTHSRLYIIYLRSNHLRSPMQS